MDFPIFHMVDLSSSFSVNVYQAGAMNQLNIGEIPGISKKLTHQDFMEYPD